VEGLKINGKNYTRNFVTHEMLMKGGTLRYQMSAEPNIQRGIKEDDAPYSFSKEKE